MKNTIITLASIATLAVSANAQTLTNSSAVFDGLVTPTSTETFSGSSGNPALVTGVVNTFNGFSVTNNATTDSFINSTANRLRLRPAPSGSISFGFNPTTAAIGFNYFDWNDSPSPLSEFRINLSDGNVVTVEAVHANPSFNESGFLGYVAQTGVTINSAQWVYTSTGPWDTVSLDDFKVFATVVPEPSSTALLGLGSLALIMRRKRS